MFISHLLEEYLRQRMTGKEALKIRADAMDPELTKAFRGDILEKLPSAKMINLNYDITTMFDEMIIRTEGARKISEVAKSMRMRDPLTWMELQVQGPLSDKVAITTGLLLEDTGERLYAQVFTYEFKVDILKRRQGGFVVDPMVRIFFDRKTGESGYELNPHMELGLENQIKENQAKRRIGKLPGNANEYATRMDIIDHHVGMAQNLAAIAVAFNLALDEPALITINEPRMIASRDERRSAKRFGIDLSQYQMADAALTDQGNLMIDGMKQVALAKKQLRVAPPLPFTLRFAPETGLMITTHQIAA